MIIRDLSGMEEFFKAEQEALSPFIPGLFDGLIDS